MKAIEKIRQIFPDVKTGKADIYEFYNYYFINAVSIAPEDFPEVLKLSHELAIRDAVCKAQHSLLEVLYHTFNPGSTGVFETIETALQNFKAINDLSGEGAVNSVQAIYLKNNGQLDKAQVALQNAFRLIDPESRYTYFLLIGYYQAGEIHHMMKDYDVAIEFFNKLIAAVKENQILAARGLNALGTVHSELKNFSAADEYYSRALELVESTSNAMLRSKIYADIANNHFQKGDYDKSFEWHYKSIALREQHLLKNPLITSYADLADLYIHLKRYDQALEYALKAESLVLELNIVIKQHVVYKILATIYEAKGEDKLALNYFKKYQQVKDEVLSQENARKIKQLNMRFEMDAMQKEKEIFTLKNVVLKNALDEIEASVRYAKRIQQTILPNDKVVKSLLPNSFILYKPKDIVAGDFYWIEQKDNVLVVAVADCTGHGVPGAMVSVICNNNLNRNLHEHGVKDPGELLNRTRENIIREFEKGDNDVQDGMDISLITFEIQSEKQNESDESRSSHSHFGLKWAGANNPLWIVRNNVLIEFTPDKQPVGKFMNAKPFTTHDIALETGDVLYLFSDGYHDQFGGPNGKKFKPSRLKELLLSIHRLPMEEQCVKLEQTFEAWRGDLEQVDDVCLIGIRV